MKYQPMEQDAKRTLVPQLRACGYNLSEDDVMRTDYFQVDFVEALDLVKTRRVYVSKGFVYVPRQDILYVLKLPTPKTKYKNAIKTSASRFRFFFFSGCCCCCCVAVVFIREEPEGGCRGP